MTRVAQISAAQGDSINELRTLRTLSSVFDVHYNNGSLVDDEGAIGSETLGPDRDYDFYYIRNNDDVFSAAKGRRIAFAYPYSKNVFEQADALLVLTDNWKDHLLRRRPDSAVKLERLYGTDIGEVACPVINVGQSMDLRMAGAEPSSVDRFRMKASTTGASVFGYYGNLNKDLYPYTAFAAIERLNTERGRSDPLVALAGRFRKESYISGRGIIHLGSLPYEKMPSLHDVTVANLTNESPLNDCLGNQKVIDSMCRGVPVMCKRYDTFVSQLGDTYPCYYETEEDAYRVARQLIDDRDFHAEVSDLCRARAKYFLPEAVVGRFLGQADELSQLMALAA